MNDVQALDDMDDHSDIFGNDLEYVAKDLRKKKDFKPWHRPRKQFVREEQWCTAISNLADAIDFDSRALRYIGLPGDELFDLRTIHEIVCKPRDLRLRFLGFNNAAANEDGDDGFELDLSTVEVKTLVGVDGQSKVMPDDFKSLGVRNSMAWINARQIGHFDVINVDLCDGLFTSKPGVTSDSYYNAIKELISFQSRRADPWLLFLTTRVGSNDVHANTVSLLRECLDSNIKTCPQFVKETQKHLGFSSIEEIDTLLKDPKGFSDIFSTGISKWLIGLGMTTNPKWKVSLVSLWNYTVFPQSEHPDLISAIYEFSLIEMPAEDKVGLVLAQKAPAPKPPTECSLAAEVVPFVANTMNVDGYLEENQ